MIRGILAGIVWGAFICGGVLAVLSLSLPDRSHDLASRPDEPASVQVPPGSEGGIRGGLRENESKTRRAEFIRKSASLQYRKVQEADALIRIACDALRELDPNAPEEWLERPPRPMIPDLGIPIPR